MAGVRTLVLAGAGLVVTLICARAADLPPVSQGAAPLVQGLGEGWYLRGNIGFGNPTVGTLSNPQDATTSSFRYLDKGFDAAPLLGVGVGYQASPWLRAELTGEYHGAANFHGFEVWTGSIGAPPTAATGTDAYSASQSDWVVLANVFADLGTWWGATPFVGAGAGLADVTISHFHDQGTVTTLAAGTTPAAGALGGSISTWNFAWALYAGFAYKVTPSLTLELAYRYLDLGSGKSGDLVDSITGIDYGPMSFNHLSSQDLMLGMRWMLDGGPRPGPGQFTPLVSKG
jgi:opacity protein-like surface antigen